MITQKECWDLMLHEYRTGLTDASLSFLVKELFARLDYTEEKMSGNVFHPTTIGSCRLAEGAKMEILLEQLRKHVKDT